jgi:hypothetical protein
LGKSENCDPTFLMDVLQEMETRGLVRVDDDGITKDYELTAHAKEHACAPHGSREPTQLLDPKRPSHGILDSVYFKDVVDGVSNSLPEPSLVYSQWWFSEPTYARLVDLLLHLMRKDAHVAFVGSSTLGAVFSHCATSPVTIIDVDEVLLKRITSCVDKRAQFICRDISIPLDTCLKGKFDIVFADPPWSSSNLTAFFVRSSEMLAAEGTLVISFPPVFTRPSAWAERRSLSRMAESLGLSFTTELTGLTEYGVPLFEYEAYKERGIELNQPWRKGDVLMFKKRSKVARRPDVPVELCWRWDQYDYGMTRLFLKRNGSTEEGPARVTPASGKNDFAYDSTSSRTQPWKRASLVSTRNQIANISGRRELASILQNVLDRGTDASNGIENLKNMLPETRRAISILLNDPNGRDNPQGESKWHVQGERSSHTA